MTGREERLSWEAIAKEVTFKVFPKRCNRGTISDMERERVPKICELCDRRWGLKELEFRGTSPCVSGGRVGVD